MRIAARFLAVFIFTATLSSFAFAQKNALQDNVWQFSVEPILKNTNQVRQIIPDIYQTTKVDINALKTILKKAPQRFSTKAATETVVLTLPMPDGGFEQFRIQKASILHPDLAARFPDINSYSGQGIDDPTATVRFDLTPKGFHAMIRSGHHSTAYIDPYASNNTEDYIVYFRKDFHKTIAAENGCKFDEFNPLKERKQQNFNGLEKIAGDCDLRTFRLALACTGEYAQFHGGTVADVLAAMNTSMTRVNGVFEMDAAITMQIIVNNDQIIFLNSATDPYTNGSGGTMLGENQTTCDNIIGSANYDIGHVYSTGGGGIAYLQAPCGGNKAGGVTGSGNPIGDPFDIDYVAHEMGHQYGANHTQNNSCNRNSSTSMEPGSASTIMGYAGICSPNVQSNSDAYFHAISIQEMGNFTVGSSSNCAITTSTGNSQPTVAGGGSHTIPGGTYFMLTADGNDADGNGSLTYCWEQFDNEVGSMPPSSTNSVGPMFRSLSPNASPTRFFPNINAIIGNTIPIWEVLATVDRTMDFRVTVRDNYLGAGCTDEADITVTVDGDTGPFLVTAPNTNVSWAAGSTQTVAWNVAGTTGAPVNAPNVDILLSIDGGFTYPITLATDVANDGSYAVSIPNNPTTTARVMVKGSGNIFFDISNQNFTIDGQIDDFFVAVAPEVVTVCQTQIATYDINITATGTFSGNVSFNATGVPAGGTSSFSPATINTQGASIFTIENTAAIAAGTYPITINATGSTGTKSTEVTLIIAAENPTVTLVSPTNDATSVSTAPILNWSAAASGTFNVQISTDSNFSNLILSASTTETTYSVLPALSANTTYYWRVNATNDCGTGSFSNSFSFTTGSEACVTYISTDVPVNISPNGTPVVISTLEIIDIGAITDLELNNLDITHSWVADLVVTITSPEGTNITILNAVCSDEDNVDMSFDDEASNLYNSIPCPPVDGGIYQPEQLLSAFDGEDLNGIWTLTIADLAAQDGGSLNNWELHICYIPVVNNSLAITATATEESCNGNQDGTATASATGGTANYVYSWSNGENGATITDLAAGDYTVTVNDGTSMATTSVTIFSPEAIDLVASGTDLACNNDGSGSVSATSATMGTYQWSNGVSLANQDGLSAGTYFVTLSDNNGCTATGSVTLSEPSLLSVTVSGINATTGNNGSATAIPTGGSINYSFLWNTGATTSMIDNLIPAVYTVTITDANDCTTLGSVVIENDTPSGDNYCDAEGDVTIFEWIEGIAVGDLSNTSGSNDGYANFTAQIANLTQGGTTSVSLIPGFINTSYQEYWKIWIDFNQDGDFDDNGELIFAPPPSNTIINDLITIPMSASLGATRMRIAMKWSGAPNPCEFFAYGEVEDYTVLIDEETGSGDCTHVLINENDFENGWGLWNDGGSDSRRRIYDANYANSDVYCVRLRDNTNTSVMTTDVLNLASFEEITVAFNYITRSMDNPDEDFWLQISTDGGNLFNTVEEWNLGDEFVNNQREFDTVTVAGPFTINTVLRFRCDASGNADWVYLDDIALSGCTNSNPSIFNTTIIDALAVNESIEIEQNEVTTSSLFKNSQLHVFPNPVKAELNINYQLSETSDAILAIFDLTGKMIFRQNLTNTGIGQQQLILDVQSFNNGYYYLKLTGTEESEVVKFLKL